MGLTGDTSGIGLRAMDTRQHCMDVIRSFSDPDQRQGFRGLAALVLWLLGAAAAHAQDRAQQLPSIPLSVGMYRITAEVARTQEERAIGLMHRRELAPNAGMLFIFEQPQTLCFWMKNTLIPLSIAFLREDGTILNIEEMKPQSLDSHCSVSPARHALEMNAGWFSKRGFKPGSRITGEPFASSTPRQP